MLYAFFSSKKYKDIVKMKSLKPIRKNECARARWCISAQEILFIGVHARVEFGVYMTPFYKIVHFIHCTITLD